MMDFFAKTDKGQRRRMNQDYVFASDQPVGTLPNLFLLADGMGGHKAGDYASRYAVDELRRYIEKAAQPQPEIRLLQEGIRDVNQRLYRLAQQNPNLSGMGTTLVIALIEGPNLTVGNIGDSRAYLIHGNSIRQITRDHSYVEEMVRRGLMRRGSKEYMASRNIITRAVGIEPQVEADFFEIELSEGDYLLLCSDGLTGMAEDSRIAEVLANAPTLELAGDALLQLALDGGGRDNITVALFTLGKKQGA